MFYATKHHGEIIGFWSKVYKFAHIIKDIFALKGGDKFGFMKLN
jgi:hypothetical protein